MLFGITTFTLIHVVLSLVGILTGLVIAGGFAAGRRLDGWVGLFLLTTALTNITGFGFPFVRFLPGHAVGIVSLLILPVVIVARYVKREDGAWRRVFVLGSMVVLYFNVLILVDQLFRRLPALIASAPTQKEPPYALTQLAVLALFLWLGWAVNRGYRAELAGATVSSPTAQQATV